MNNQSLEKLYNFPPMYTKQRNEHIIHTQIQKWCELIKLYYQHNAVFLYREESLHDLFTNDRINRSVDNLFQKEIIDSLRKDEHLIKIVDMKHHLQNDQKFLKYWKRYESSVSNKPIYKHSEMLLFDEHDLEKNERIFDDKANVQFREYILPNTLSFYEDVFVSFLDMSMNDGNGIFTVYEMSGINGLFNINDENECFLRNQDLHDTDIVEGKMDSTLTVYLLFKLLIEKGVCYPIIEDDELVAVKKTKTY